MLLESFSERHLMLDIQLLDHKPCKDTCPSHLSVVSPDPSDFGTAVLRVRWLVVVLGRPIVLIGVSGCTNLVSLVCFLLRHRAPQLCDLVVVQRLDVSEAYRVFGLDEVAAGPEWTLARTLSAESGRSMFIERRLQPLSRRGESVWPILPRAVDGV